MREPAGNNRGGACPRALSILVFALFLAAVGHPARCQDFRLPEIPDSLAAPEARAEYLALHWWDGFDFRDTSLISRPGITEQAFVDFLSVLPYVSDIPVAFDTLFCRASAEPEMFSHFVTLGEKYLAGRYSPMRDEELYIAMLGALCSDGRPFPEGERARAGFRLELALKNRPGDPAADFGFLFPDGARGTLYGLDAEYLIVFFNDPDCAECRATRAGLEDSSELSALLGEGRVRVLSVCVSGDASVWKGSFSSSEGWTDVLDDGRAVYSGRLYDLRQLPVLYLLSSDKHVLLKDTSLREILDIL